MPSGDGPQVVVPGRPGEPAQVLPGAEAAQRHVPDPVSPADVTFVQRMIPHHQQALEMAELAPGRAADRRVLALAERISVAQGPEIAAMQAWLERPEVTVLTGGEPGHGGHADHSGMPGMATPAQLAALGAARGTDFDRLFLELMIAHHEGALRMAHEVLTAGTDVTAGRLAQDVGATQSAEIARMREMLAG
ncbi:MAG TPA: DUF305 domain-containing protein [Pseudonocardia sp.]|nr:DUF305 domain-containing protein [Pseudonocardia sp.]